MKCHQVGWITGNRTGLGAGDRANRQFVNSRGYEPSQSHIPTTTFVRGRRVDLLAVNVGRDGRIAADISQPHLHTRGGDRWYDARSQRRCFVIGVGYANDPRPLGKTDVEPQGPRKLTPGIVLAVARLQNVFTGGGAGELELVWADRSELCGRQWHSIDQQLHEVNWRFPGMHFGAQFAQWDDRPFFRRRLGAESPGLFATIVTAETER